MSNMGSMMPRHVFADTSSEEEYEVPSWREADKFPEIGVSLGKERKTDAKPEFETFCKGLEMDRQDFGPSKLSCRRSSEFSCMSLPL
jgi:hypothetical protein